MFSLLVSEYAYKKEILDCILYSLIHSVIHSQALIVQDGPFASLFGVSDHTHTDTR
jgi:hypothetical protein